MTANSHAQLFELPIQERLELVAALWDSIAKSGDDLPVPAWQVEELDRRKEDFMADPKIASPWEEARQRILSVNG